MPSLSNIRFIFPPKLVMSVLDSSILLFWFSICCNCINPLCYYNVNIRENILICSRYMDVLLICCAYSLQLIFPPQYWKVDEDFFVSAGRSFFKKSLGNNTNIFGLLRLYYRLQLLIWKSSIQLSFDNVMQVLFQHLILWILNHLYHK